jgi:xylan 1,4-beta-xylosidase
VTKRGDGVLAIAAWNLSDPGEAGETRTMALQVHGVRPDATVSILRVDNEHGNVLEKYAAMGKPEDPTETQVEQLNRETALGEPTHIRLKDGRLNLELERNALVLIKVGE